MKKNSAHTRLIELQKKIHRTLEREAQAIFGPAVPAIRAYERACSRDFQGRHQISTKSELIRAIRDTDVTLLADHHAFAQSQRTALRLLREAVLPGEHWALGLEFIPSQFQSELDLYQSGKMDLETFLQTIRYREDWGFPWRNYAPLLEWARQHSVKVLALNRPKPLLPIGRSIRDLHARDQWAAGIISDYFHENKNPLRVFVLYGGYHVGQQHLPRHLSRISKAFLGKPLRALSVHQNVDQLYWKLAQSERELQAQVLRFKKNIFCVFSGTPWSQLQSMIECADGHLLNNSGLAHESSDDDDDSSVPNDSLTLMSKYGELIADFLELPRPSFDSLTVHGVDEADFTDTLGDALSAHQLRMIHSWIESNQRFYLPRVQVAYIATPSSNAIAELAAQHLYFQRTRIDDFFSGGSESFYQWILLQSFGHLGSLVVNPRRKCDLPMDHQKRLRVLKKKPKKIHFQEQVSREWALELLRMRKLRLEIPKSASLKATAPLLGARYSAQILASRLYHLLMDLKQGDPRFQNLVNRLVARSNFEEHYHSLVRITTESAALQRPLLSKLEQL